jgi:hypothetical protein
LLSRFLDVTQAFDKVWHQVRLLKIKQIIPPVYFNILKSYLQNGYFVTTYNNETSPPFPMFSGVPQGRILVPLLYTMCTSDNPQSNTAILSTFADDVAIITTHLDPTLAFSNLQDHLRAIENWTRKWRLKINETKCSHIKFTLRRGHCPPVYINQTVVPQAETVKYFELHFDKRLTWKNHVAMERKQLNLKTREIYWLIGKHSPYRWKTSFSSIKQC